MPGADAVRLSSRTISFYTQMAKFNSNVYFGYKIKKPLEAIEPTWAPVGRLVWPSRCNVNKNELVRTWQNLIATFE